MTTAPTKEKRLSKAERAALSAAFDADQEVRGRQRADDWVKLEPFEALRQYIRWQYAGVWRTEEHAFLLRVHELAQQARS